MEHRVAVTAERVLQFLPLQRVTPLAKAVPHVEPGLHWEGRAATPPPHSSKTFLPSPEPSMQLKTLSRAALAAIAAISLAACSESSSPTSALSPASVARSGGVNSGGVNAGGGTSTGGTTTGGTSTGGTNPDTTGVQVSGSGLGGGGAYTSCGTLSTNIQAYNITVYTTRVGIGLSGSAYNCGTRKEAFEVDVVDTETDPACAVDMPHFIAAKNTDPGLTTYWSVNSTLVNCQGRTHTFNVRLWDTKTGQTLATGTASAFL
jgi:hypothetical protein